MGYFTGSIRGGLTILAIAVGVADGDRNLGAQGLAGSAGGSLVLEATGDSGLHSASLDLEGTQPMEARRLECRFGFSTQENYVEGLLVDSLSAVLLDSQNRRAMVLFTLSSAGLSLMPVTADSLSVDLGEVELEEIPAPTTESGFRGRFAYRLQTPIPAAFAPGKVRVALALYDNQDDLASRAWMDSIVMVPEPSGLRVVLLAVLICGAAWRPSGPHRRTHSPP